MDNSQQIQPGSSNLPQNAPFVLKPLKRSQFLSPAVQTAAMTSLAQEMTTHFAGEERNPDDKPTCVTCFDMSGSGKTTTISEAAKISNSIRAPISLINNQLFTELFQSCKKFGSRQDPRLKLDDLVTFEKVENYMAERFDSVLIQLFQSIIEQLNGLDTSNLENGAVIEVSIPKYISPTSSSEGIHKSTPSLQESYQNVIDTVEKLDRLLVIHLDDCQEFFCGSTKNPEKTADNEIRVGDLMCFALRLFSRRVSSLMKCREILWVFSGTRPNLYLEMKVASSFGEPYDVTKTLRDLTESDVATVLSNYFRLDHGDSVLKEKFKNLCGHPKMLYWFILIAQQHTMASVADLVLLWDKIEDGAVGLYRQQIESTIKAFGLPPEKLEIYSRNLCLLHTHAFVNNESGYLEFNVLPSNWMPFIEAGLIRTAQNGTWKLYPPNRFLVKIFNRYVKWFSWSNIRNLIAAINVSTTTHTHKGKVFEYLFALELCSRSDSVVWKKLGSDMKLQPKLNWNPSIWPIGTITNDLDQDKVYVMVDPDRSNSKTDVIFFARKLNSEENVRVLCQLTTQVADSTSKATQSFLSMFPLQADIPDYRLFLASHSSVAFPSDHRQQFSGANCFWFDSSQVASMLHFPQDICDPTKTDDSLELLMNFAVSHDEPQVASNIALFLPRSHLKRKREEFATMEEFYEALRERGRSDAHIQIIKKVFEYQLIKIKQLPRLTDEDLEKAGLKQLGLRKAVLALLGK
jgi:hypothetical protein